MLAIELFGIPIRISRRSWDMAAGIGEEESAMAKVLLTMGMMEICGEQEAGERGGVLPRSEERRVGKECRN